MAGFLERVRQRIGVVKGALDGSLDRFWDEMRTAFKAEEARLKADVDAARRTRDAYRTERDDARHALDQCERDRQALALERDLERSAREILARRCDDLETRIGRAAHALRTPSDPRPRVLPLIREVDAG